jgi:hypothetical protein
MHKYQSVVLLLLLLLLLLFTANGFLCGGNDYSLRISCWIVPEPFPDEFQVCSVTSAITASSRIPEHELFWYRHLVLLIHTNVVEILEDCCDSGIRTRFSDICDSGIRTRVSGICDSGMRTCVSGILTLVSGVCDSGIRTRFSCICDTGIRTRIFQIGKPCVMLGFKFQLLCRSYGFEIHSTLKCIHGRTVHPGR